MASVKEHDHLRAQNLITTLISLVSQAKHHVHPGILGIRIIKGVCFVTMMYCIINICLGKVMRLTTLIDAIDVKQSLCLQTFWSPAMRTSGATVIIIITKDI